MLMLDMLLKILLQHIGLVILCNHNHDDVNDDDNDDDNNADDDDLY